MFGTKITRVTGDPGTAIITTDGKNIGTWGERARHHYSKDQVWNADQSLIILDRHDGTPNPVYLDGYTYKPLSLYKAPGEDRWHPTQPDIRIYVAGNEIGTFNIRTGKKVFSKTFSGYAGFQFGPSEGNPSFDGNWLAVLATNPSGSQVAFAYNFQTDTKYPDIPISYRVGSLTISPKGTYIVVNGDGIGVSSLNSRNNEDQTQAYDLQGNKVGPLWEEYGRPSHFDLTIDNDGSEIGVGVSKSSPDSGKLIKRRITDGRVTVLAPGASHTSTRNYQRPGWAYASNPASPYTNEIIAVKLDGSMVERFGYIPNNKTDYYAEPHASPSHDGKKVIIASNWNLGSRPISAYVVEALCDNPSTTCSSYDYNSSHRIDLGDMMYVLANWNSGRLQDLLNILRLWNQAC